MKVVKGHTGGRTRFNIGDRVKILPNVPTPFVGLEGAVGEVLPHDRSISSLDRYVVLFAWGERQSFYDVQLAQLAPPTLRHQAINTSNLPECGSAFS